MRKEHPDTLLTLQIVDFIRNNMDEVLSPKADPERWTDEIKGLFPSHTVWNWTDFNYGKAYAYEVFLHKGQFPCPGSVEEQRRLLKTVGDTCYSMLLRLSAIGPYYAIQFVRRKVDPSAECRFQEKIKPRPWRDADTKFWVIANKFCVKHNLEYLGDDLLATIIPDLKLELAEEGSTTIYNCLFEDSAS